MDGKYHSDAVFVKNDEHAIGHWRKDDPCDEVVNNLLNHVHILLFCANDEDGYLAAAIFLGKVRVCGLTSQSKMQEEQHCVQMEVLN